MSAVSVAEAAAAALSWECLRRSWTNKWKKEVTHIHDDDGDGLPCPKPRLFIEIRY
ncbi:hypothetical protein N9L68_03475 [bacterium]|nr:hypothetical protein [bacterium]